MRKPGRRRDYNLKKGLEAIIWEDVEWIDEFQDRDKSYPVIKLWVP